MSQQERPSTWQHKSKSPRLAWLGALWKKDREARDSRRVCIPCLFGKLSARKEALPVLALYLGQFGQCFLDASILELVVG